MKHHEKGGLKHAFEKVILPALQDKSRLGGILESQLSEKNKFEGFSVSRLSSYGVLAKSCDKIQDTLEWIEDATSSWIEGTVPPFCYPDKHFGPDLMFLLWNSDFTDFEPASPKQNTRSWWIRCMHYDRLYQIYSTMKSVTLSNPRSPRYHPCFLVKRLKKDGPLSNQR